MKRLMVGLVPRKLVVRLLPGCVLLLGWACGGTPGSEDAGQVGLDLTTYRMVDLSHAYNASTLYWPTSTERFALKQQAFGTTPGGWFYAANSISTPEHGGTHLDAPIHFAQDRNFADQIPLEKLIAPAVVIDVSAQASSNPDYRLSPEDVLAFEQQHGRIEPGTIVLLRTGWSRFWPNAKQYLGDDSPGDASRLHFPSFGEAAVRLLVAERQVAALGADVASIDYGASQDFIVHRIANEANVPGFENLTNLQELPARGAVVIALPMKIERGSGAPLRAVALVRRAVQP
ncbi:MAG: cyclase family protein [Longimicrobiales bacterium]